MANLIGTLDVISLLAAAWASKTDGDVKLAFEKIHEFARNSVEEEKTIPVDIVEGIRIVPERDAEQRRAVDPAEQKSALELPEWYQMAEEFFGEIKVFSIEMYDEMNGTSVLAQLRRAAEREAKTQISKRSAGN